MSIFIVFPDTSKAGKVRFFDALVDHRAKVPRSHEGPPIQFLVEVEDREVFAEDCGTPDRPAVTENAPKAAKALANVEAFGVDWLALGKLAATMSRP